MKTTLTVRSPMKTRFRKTSRYVPRAVVAAKRTRARDETKHAGVDDERRGVGEEQSCERRHVRGRRDQPAGEATEADAEVHHHALHREGRRPLARLRQAGDERALARPEAAVSDPRDGGGEEAVPRLVDERIARVPGRHEQQCHRQHAASAEAVDQRAADRTGDQPDRRVRAHDEAGHAEADPAHVVQIDEQERVREPVPEGVHERAQLQDLHVARQRRHERARVTREHSHDARA